jgi:hypothetical protein
MVNFHNLNIICGEKNWKNNANWRENEKKNHQNIRYKHFERKKATSNKKNYFYS